MLAHTDKAVLRWENSNGDSELISLASQPKQAKGTVLDPNFPLNSVLSQISVA